jgi:hypothetical protein
MTKEDGQRFAKAVKKDLLVQWGGEWSKALSEAAAQAIVDHHVLTQLLARDDDRVFTVAAIQELTKASRRECNVVESGL